MASRLAAAQHKQFALCTATLMKLISYGFVYCTGTVRSLHSTTLKASAVPSPFPPDPSSIPLPDPPVHHRVT